MRRIVMFNRVTEGRPDRLSWHGIVHAIAPVLGLLSLIAACVVMARRFGTSGERRWAAYSYATGAAALALSAWPPSENCRCGARP